jgi:K+-sensing histidine kinase KdpD
MPFKPEEVVNIVSTNNLLESIESNESVEKKIILLFNLLYLCKKIVQDHNGYISVTDNLPQGSIFTATFTLQHE